MSEIIPAILPKDTADLKLKLSQIPNAIELIHLDVLEKDIWLDTDTKIDLDFEAHLMVARPEIILNKWVERGARRLIVHQISNEILKFKDKLEIGLAVELKTPISEIFPLVHQVDFIHLMSIDALGTQGDDFESRIFDRIKELKKAFPEVTVSVDGGISVENYQELFKTGADRLVVGSHFKDLWNSLMKK